MRRLAPGSCCRAASKPTPPCIARTSCIVTMAGIAVRHQCETTVPPPAAVQDPIARGFSQPTPDVRGRAHACSSLPARVTRGSGYAERPEQRHVLIAKLHHTHKFWVDNSQSILARDMDPSCPGGRASRHQGRREPTPTARLLGYRFSQSLTPRRFSASFRPRDISNTRIARLGQRPVVAASCDVAFVSGKPPPQGPK